MTTEEKLVRRLRRDKLIELLNLFNISHEYEVYKYGELLEEVKAISTLEIKRIKEMDK